MKLKTALITTVAASALMSQAHADAYFSVFGGVEMLDDSSLDLQIGPFVYSTTLVSYVTQTTLKTSVANDTRHFLTSNSRYVTMVVTQIRNFQTTRNSFQKATLEFQEEDLDSGFVIGAALGYRFDIGLRPEIEIAHRSHGVGGRHRFQDDVNFFSTVNWGVTLYGIAFYHSGPGKTTYAKTATNSSYVREFEFTAYNSSATRFGIGVTDGEINTFSVMANLWYDFDLGRDSPVTPFIGVGGGMAKVDFSYSGRFILPSTTTVISTAVDEWVPAWQFGAGIAFDVMGNATFTAQYRYFATQPVDLAGGGEVSNVSHAALLGFQFPLGR